MIAPTLIFFRSKLNKIRSKLNKIR
jgi:hypothetical protein